MSLVEVVVVAVWAMLPAYLPNNVAVVAGGGRPLDGGRTMGGRRLLGDGKTYRGTAIGTLAGVTLAGGLTVAEHTLSISLGFALPRFSPPVAVALPAGAMLGDIAASFLKRRVGRDRGDPVPILDQLDFVVGALGLTAAVAPGWFRGVFLAPPAVLVTVVVLTPLFHVVTNVGAYLLGLKAEPY